MSTTYKVSVKFPNVSHGWQEIKTVDDLESAKVIYNSWADDFQNISVKLEEIKTVVETLEFTLSPTEITK